jgi:CheY-like chemotaxis protein
MTTILLVDDDDQFRSMVAEVLSRASYEVQQARNGNEATVMYSNHQTDLVITDLMMPEKEGLETIREIRHLNPDVRIIAMSGGGRNGFEDYLKVAKVFGARVVIDKPFTHQEILGAIHKALAT